MPPKNGGALLGIAAHGLKPTRKNERVLAHLPKAKEPKMTERHLEEEEKEKARIVDAPKVELNPLPSLLEGHRPRARKTGSLAGTTF